MATSGGKSDGIVGVIGDLICARSASIVPESSTAANSDSESSRSWMQVLVGGSGKTPLKYFEHVAVDGRHVIKPPKSVIEEGRFRWKNALVGQFLGNEKVATEPAEVVVEVAF
ncbi:hypothetical protein CRG98_020346 [Punica granatum]|uniref:Uncharacterized protein n=1 Tax=Punica granatum TaxID=22663 RepID=A0A2I0JUX2_PUNGR|nr:hypothetical protein CRG98_020346 [Punica granatum]